MVCKKLKIYNNLRVILDNYERYIDFKYRAVSNIWSSVDIEDKLTYGEYYKNFFVRIKKKLEKNSIKLKCLFINHQFQDISVKMSVIAKTKDLSLAVEREIFVEIYRRIKEIITRGKMKDFNSACESIFIRVLENNMEKHRYELENY